MDPRRVVGFLVGSTSPFLVTNGLFPLPFHALSVGPEVFEGVVFAGSGVEDMDDYVAVVLYDPAAGFVAFDAVPGIADRGEGGVGLFGNGVHLSPRAAGNNHLEIADGSDA